MNRRASLSPTDSSHLKGVFLIAVIFFSLIFTFMRTHELAVRPLHNDEGVNAWFLMRMINDNHYRYDPQNYHGPSLFYIQYGVTWANSLMKRTPDGAPSPMSAGVTDRSLRAGVVVASLLVLLGLLFSHHRLGPWGAFGAFLLAGMSLHFLYYSRYFIHEMYFLLFTLGLYGGATRYRDTERPVYFYLFMLSASLLFATKETSIITFFVMGFSVVCAEGLHRLLAKPRGSEAFGAAIRREFRWLWTGLAGRHVGALLLAVLVWLVLYSSFFTNWGGLADSVRTYAKWFREGVESGHVKPFFFWVDKVLLPYERALIVASLVGAVAAWVKRDKKGLYLVFWSLGMLGAYSVIPYKTVWCALNFILPMAMLGGYGLQALLDGARSANPQRFKRIALATGLGGAALLALDLPQTLRVVYREYDDERHAAPYVHTSRDIFNLLDEIHRLTAGTPLKRAMSINIFSEAYWPLPHYLRDYPDVRYWGTMAGIKEKDAPLIIASKDQETELDSLLLNRYRKKEFALRSNLKVILYIDELMFQDALAAGSTSRPAKGAP